MGFQWKRKTSTDNEPEITSGSRKQDITEY